MTFIVQNLLPANGHNCVLISASAFLLSHAVTTTVQALRIHGHMDKFTECKHVLCAQAGSERQERADVVTGNKVLRLAAAVEGVMRCSNNLLERLHHSYFMYLQPSTKAFITIEAYVVPASLMLLGLFLLAVSMLMPASSDSTCTLSTDAVIQQSTKSTAPAIPEKVYPEKVIQPVRLLGGWPELTQGFSRVLAVHSICAVVGLVLHWGLAQFTGGVIHCCLHCIAKEIAYTPNTSACNACTRVLCAVSLPQYVRP
jgi:hypothetical protein